jgi:hypothetical protein
MGRRVARKGYDRYFINPRRHGLPYARAGMRSHCYTSVDRFAVSRLSRCMFPHDLASASLQAPLLLFDDHGVDKHTAASGQALCPAT